MNLSFLSLIIEFIIDGFAIVQKRIIEKDSPKSKIL